MMSLRFVRIAGLLAVLHLVNPAWAQESAGSVTGLVTDAYGGMLPGATVTLAADRWSRTSVTDLAGRYRIEGVPAGVYTVWFAIRGFDTAAFQTVSVHGESLVQRDATLKMTPWCDHCATAPVERHEVAVIFETTAGTFMIAVDPAHAPITSANFLDYVDGRLYDGGRFHRATRAENYTVSPPNRPLLECIQAGIDPTRQSKALPPIPLERTTATTLQHVAGTVSMARGAPDSARSDFFILLNDQPSLDFGGKRFDDEQGAAAFGRVVSGMDVVRKIQQQPTSGQSLTPPITIVSAKRVQP